MSGSGGSGSGSGGGPGTFKLKEAAEHMKKIVSESKFWQSNGKEIKKTLSEWIGPLGVSIVLAGMFLKGLRGVLRQSDLIRRSLEAWAQVEVYTPSFTRMLGGLGEARKRLGEIARMSAGGVFKFGDLADGNRRLHVLTRGLFSGKAAMKVVEDAAIASGRGMRGFAETADEIGSAMDAIMRRSGEDGALEGLGRSGVISTDGADRLRKLASSGASAEEILSGLREELAKNAGAADAFAETLAGISAQMENVGQMNLADVGELFAEGKAAGMRAGLMLLKAYGPALVEVMRPLAAVFNGFNKMVEAIAGVLSVKGVVSFVTGLAKVLTVLALALHAKGIQIFVRDMIGLIGMLFKLPGAAKLASGASQVLGKALLFLGRMAWNALGPMGKLMLLITGLAEAMKLLKVPGFSGKGFFDGTVAGGLKEIQDANDEVQKSLSAGAGIGDKGNDLARASEAVDKAKAVRQQADADKKAGVGWAGNILMGASAGLLAPGPWQVKAAVGVAGAIGGGIASMSQAGKQEQMARDASEAEGEAKKNLQKAREQNVVDPSEYLNDPDYAAAKARGEEKLKQLTEKDAELGARLERARAMRDGLDEGSDSRKMWDKKIAGLEAEREGVRGDMKAVGAGVSPEVLREEFTKRVTMAGASAAARLAEAQSRGDRSGAMNAQREMVDLGMQGRQKELQDQGFTKEEAGRISKLEGLTQLQDMLMGQGQVFASGRAGVGMAMGEAAGGVPPEFQKVIDEIRKIQEQIPGLKPEYEPPDELK